MIDINSTYFSIDRLFYVFCPTFTYVDLLNVKKLLNISLFWK